MRGIRTLGLTTIFLILLLASACKPKPPFEMTTESGKVLDCFSYGPEEDIGKQIASKMGDFWVGPLEQGERLHVALETEDVVRVLVSDLSSRGKEEEFCFEDRFQGPGEFSFDPAVQPSRLYSIHLVVEKERGPEFWVTTVVGVEKGLAPPFTVMHSLNVVGGVETLRKVETAEEGGKTTVQIPYPDVTEFQTTPPVVLQSGTIIILNHVRESWLSGGALDLWTGIPVVFMESSWDTNRIPLELPPGNWLLVVNSQEVRECRITVRQRSYVIHVPEPFGDSV